MEKYKNFQNIGPQNFRPNFLGQIFLINLEDKAPRVVKNIRSLQK